MFDACVLGVDPGVARLGLAVVTGSGRSPQLRWATSVRTSPAMQEAERLAVLARAVREAIEEHRPSAVSIERVAWNRNQVSALHVARATGAVMAAAAEAGLPVEEYGPNEVKVAVTGAGNADKRQVQDALARIHGLRDVPADPDAADAVAVALTHLVGARLRAIARAGAR
jgi:crossover junction endodeoxyribonuclease RuvC